MVEKSRRIPFLQYFKDLEDFKLADGKFMSSYAWNEA